ncbi:hypothetical protein ACWV26_06490 [Rummeliibacillus sp. JY-2-4R]
MNTLNFRKQDVEKAMKEHNCINTLQKQLEIHIERGSYAAAQICLEDINKSIKELCRLRKVKREHDRLVKTAELMQKRGVDLRMVTRCVN